MGGVGLGGEVARVVRSFQADAESIEGDVLAQLGKQSHAFGIMHLYILEHGIEVPVEKNAGSGAVPGAHGHHGARYEAAVFPVRGGEGACRGGGHSFGLHVEVAGVVDDVAFFFFKGNARSGACTPSLAVGLEQRVLGDAPLHPRGGHERDSLPGVVLCHPDLGDVRIGKVDTEIAQGAVGGVEQCQWEHPSVEDEFGAVAFQRKVPEAFQFNPHFLGVGLVVIGDVVGAGSGTCFMEEILSLGKAQYDAVFRTAFGLDAVDDPLQYGAGIFPAVGFQPHPGKVIDTFGTVQSVRVAQAACHDEEEACYFVQFHL